MKLNLNLAVGMVYGSNIYLSTKSIFTIDSSIKKSLVIPAVYARINLLIVILIYFLLGWNLECYTIITLRNGMDPIMETMLELGMGLSYNLKSRIYNVVPINKETKIG